MTYIKRLAMPKTWPLPRKGSIYVARPLPGRKLQNCLPVSLVVKHLSFAKTSKEVKFILNEGRVKVSNVIVKEPAFPIGLFDVISFPSIKKHYRMLLKNKKLFLHEIDERESTLKPAKIIGKNFLKGKKLQVNLDDGRNLLSAPSCKVGDTLVINLADGKVASHLKFEQGCLAYLLGGKHTGKIARVIEISSYVVCDLGGSKVNVLQKHIFVIGKEKPVISLPHGDGGKND